MYACKPMYLFMYVDLRKNVPSGETSLVKPESLYVYYNGMLIQRINFLGMSVLDARAADSASLQGVCLYSKGARVPKRCTRTQEVHVF